MIKDVKKFFKDYLVFTADGESLSQEAIYDIYCMQASDKGEEPIAEFAFYEELIMYLNKNTCGNVGVSVKEPELSFYRKKFKIGLLPSEFIPDNDNTYTLVTADNSMRQENKKVLVFSTVNKKQNREFLKKHATRHYKEFVYSVISPEAMKLLKEYIHLFVDIYEENNALLKDYMEEEEQRERKYKKSR